MAVKFNPFTGQLQIDEKGSGGGSSYIDGEVQNFSALPQTVGSPAVDSAYLVREAEGTWLLNRKPAGIYVRTANTGTRASDWTHASAFPDVFNDANLVVYSNGDSSKNLAFNVGGITTGTTRTLTAPDASGTIALTSDIPAGLADGDKGDITVSATGATWTIDNSAVSYAKIQDVSATDKLLGRSSAGAGVVEEIACTSAGRALLDDADAAAQRTTLGLGTAATSASTDFAAASHSHELTALDATGATNGHVLTAQGDGTAAFAAASGGVSAVNSTLADILSVSGSDLVADDLGTDKLYGWDDSASKAIGFATVGPTFDGTTLRWPVELVVACSDETTDLTTGTAKVTFRAPCAFLLTAVRASVNTAPTGSTLIVDINNGANSALSTKLSIDASEKTSTTAATAAVIDTTYDDISDDAEITIDIDQIGSTVAGKGLKVTLIGTRA